MSTELFAFIFIHKMGAKMIISSKINIIQFIELYYNDKIDVDNESILFGLFEAYVYYFYINRLKGINICICFICLKMKY